MKTILEFLKELAANNNRDWFTIHKQEYLRIKDFINDFTQSLLNGMLEWEPDVKYLQPSDCTYRIYRDTRFSLDKTPYKTHIGIFINPPAGKKSYRMGYYLHLEPRNCFMGTGNVCLPPALVNDMRISIRDNIEEYLSIIENPEFKALFTKIGENPVKTAPKGFKKDWQYIELVKPKDYFISHTLTTKEITSAKFLERALEIFKAGKPFADFFNYTIDDYID